MLHQPRHRTQQDVDSSSLVRFRRHRFVFSSFGAVYVRQLALEPSASSSVASCARCERRESSLVLPIRSSSLWQQRHGIRWIRGTNVRFPRRIEKVWFNQWTQTKRYHGHLCCNPRIGWNATIQLDIATHSWRSDHADIMAGTLRQHVRNRRRCGSSTVSLLTSNRLHRFLPVILTAPLKRNAQQI